MNEQPVRFYKEDYTYALYKEKVCVFNKQNEKGFVIFFDKINTRESFIEVFGLK